MSQQYPQQPGQPQQPQWGAPQQQQWGAPPPQPPKKRSVGKVVGLGCLGIVGLFVVIAIIAAVASSGGSKTSSSGTNSTASAQNAGGGKAKTDGKAKAGGSNADKAASTVVFKVWGTAPAGELGPADVTYGSDSDNRQGHWKNGGFTSTLPFKSDAMYYAVNAQLQGSGDIHCSVTVDGKTKTGHASGGYNICSAQLSSGFSGWE
ncbi:hypothetical protein ACFXI6_14270 [Streptomyces mirabilis]|uniref:hypothetical protein n=1 Tax=Streptomyces mirabilis TaxID=68239 RepID=UPI0036855B27